MDSRSKRSRDDRDKHRHRDNDDKHRDRRHRSDRDRDRHHLKSFHREDRGEHEGSRDRRERENSYERDVKREKSYEDDDRESDDSYDRHHDSSRKKKRKERGENEEREKYDREKRARVFEYDEEEEKKKKGEKRRFEDTIAIKEENNSLDKSVSVEKDKREVNVSDSKVKEEVKDESVGGTIANGGVSVGNGATDESVAKTSGILPGNSMASAYPVPTKVSSISNTNENKGVSISRSHEVPGKSSTDGASSAAGNSGSLSLDALAKAKKALQIQKELSEKLKKIPLLSKGTNSKAQSSSSGSVSSVPSTTIAAPVSAGTVPSSSNLSAAAHAALKTPPSDGASVPAIAGTSNYEAVKRAQELAAKMGFRQDPQFAPLINLFPGQIPAEVTAPQKPTKAPVLRVDALGREIDEHGNIVNVTKPANLSTLKVNINKQKKEAFQIIKPDFNVDPESDPHFDPRMGINKNKIIRPKKMSFEFVEEGKWSREAELMKIRNQFGEERAKDEKARQALHAKAKAAPDINPNLIEVAERVMTKEKPKEPIPAIEWWDVPLLPAGSYGDIVDGNITEQKLKMEKLTIYVEHPRPIEPPAESAPPPPQPLKLTKKEQKKLRTQRRLAREKDRQEMIRQGLLEPPKPKVKMSNLMKVLGSEATQDPTRLEKEIRTAAAEREQAHIDRNIARKLTPAERREKKERKLFDDPNTVEAIVSVYKINDLSHKKTRFKVDVNAHENRLTGCGAILEGMTVLVVEGGSKSIKRYGKLMLRRINWAEEVNEEDGEDNDDKPPNKCVLVWQGSVAKPNFRKFSLHECVTEAAARKLFADAGVGHYWDLAVNFSDEQM